jgi:uncharacterized protein (TIGR02271 family)
MTSPAEASVSAGTLPPAAGLEGAAGVDEAMNDDQQPLRLVEETASVTTEEVVTGRVRVRTETEMREEVARATLQGEEIEVTRVPIDRPVAAVPEIRTEGDLTIVPVVEEVLFVEKRLVLKEEVHVRRRRTRETIDLPVELRRQRAVIERAQVDDGDTANSNQDPKEWNHE